MSWNIARVLAWSSDYLGQKGSGSPRLDADLLLADVLGVERIRLYTDPERPLEPSELERYREHIARRATGQPLAYLLGHREFYGRRFRVGPGVLVPRPETELLIEVALGCLPPAGDAEIWAADLGTGSGNIAITLALQRPDLHVLASDVSEVALGFARENACALEVKDRVSFVEGDRLAPFAASDRVGRLTILVSNPPYVSRDEQGRLGFGVERHEPSEALFPGDGDALSFYRTLAAEAPQLLLPDGWLACEIGAGQAAAVSELFRASLEQVQVKKDLAGIPRVVFARARSR